MHERIHNQIFWLSSLANAFFLPVFGRVLPLIIIVMVLNWLIKGNIFTNFRGLFSEKKRLQTLSFASLYVLYVIGLFYTSNYDYARFDLEVKMSLLIFPLVFASSPLPAFSQKQYDSVLAAFIAGCLTGALIILGHAFLNQYSENISGSFYYTKLAWYFHSSYLAMYYNFAIIILLLALLGDNRRPLMQILLFSGFILFFIWMILLLASKAGLITLAVVLVLTSVYSSALLKKIKIGMAILGIGICTFLTGYFITPVAFARMSVVEKVVVDQNKHDRLTPESNADRLVVWKTAVQIIGQNFFFGVGTGDVKDALLEGYARQQAMPALQHKYNAHSQYLQTFVALGFTGFLLLALIFFGPALFALKTHHYLYFFFLLIFALNALTESMLEVQAGVIFYAFFNIILFTNTGAVSKMTSPQN